MDSQLLIALNRIVIVVACAAGAYSSFAFGDRIDSRRIMFQLWIVCVIMGYAFSAVFNATIHYWLPKFELTIEVRAGIAAIVSCFTRFLIPAIIERIGPWLDKIPFLKKKES